MKVRVIVLALALLTLVGIFAPRAAFATPEEPNETDSFFVTLLWGKVMYYTADIDFDYIQDNLYWMYFQASSYYDSSRIEIWECPLPCSSTTSWELIKLAVITPSQPLYETPEWPKITWVEPGIVSVYSSSIFNNKELWYFKRYLPLIFK